MDASSSQNSRIIDISRDLPDAGRNICGEAACEFSECSYDSQERSTSMRKLWAAVTLCIIFMSVELIGGIKANSLALLTDAAHLLTDLAAFAISLLSLWTAGWKTTPRHSYGFFRMEILGALVSIQLIWLLTGIIVYQAIHRLVTGSEEVNGFILFLIAAVGLVVNIIMAVLLGHDHGHDHGHGHCHHGHDHGHNTHHHDDKDHIDHHGNEGVTEPLPSESEDKSKKRNINVQGAYLHVLGDAIQSVGVMIGGAVIWYKPEWKIVDLICTIFFSLIVLATTIKMLRNILEVLMESTPREIDATQLETGILEMEEVVAVHELHIWAITVGKTLLACHVKINRDADADMVLDKVVDYIRRVYNISHVTIQIEH